MQTHWTAQSSKHFSQRIVSDFIGQLESKLETIPMSRAQYANMLNISPSRVSQFLNNPSNISAEKLVEYARPLGMKVAIVAYEDGDPNNEHGPIIADVFTQCWEQYGKPSDLFAFKKEESSVAHFFPINRGATLNFDVYQYDVLQRSLLLGSPTKAASKNVLLWRSPDNEGSKKAPQSVFTQQPQAQEFAQGAIDVKEAI